MQVVTPSCQNPTKWKLTLRNKWEEEKEKDKGDGWGKEKNRKGERTEGWKEGKKKEREGREGGSQGEGKRFHKEKKRGWNRGSRSWGEESLSWVAHLNKIGLPTGSHSGDSIHHSRLRLPWSMGKSFGHPCNIRIVINWTPDTSALNAMSCLHQR